MCCHTSENSYAGLGNDFHKRGWWSVVIADVMEDIRSMILANAKNIEMGIKIFEEEWDLILAELEHSDFALIEKQLIQTAKQLGSIPMKLSPKEVPTISLVGEIFVRRDSLSRQYLTERLAEKGFATICSPVAEWLKYSNYLVEKGLVDYTMSKMEKFDFLLKKRFMAKYEKHIKSILASAGLVCPEPIDIKKIIKNASPYISPNLVGEAILTIGSSFTEVATHTCGVIAIGPFGCMPNRLSEAILNESMDSGDRLSTEPKNKKLQAALANIEDLPFLAIESDGSPFPQLINAKLEAFCLQAERLHERMLVV